MSDQPPGQDVLRELVAKWRRISEGDRSFTGSVMRVCANELEAAAAALSGASSPSQPAGSFGYCAVCYHPLDRCSHCDGASSPSGATIVAGARAFWKAQDLLNAMQAIATDTMIAASDPHGTADEYRTALTRACQAALAAVQSAQPMEPQAAALSGDSK